MMCQVQKKEGLTSGKEGQWTDGCEERLRELLLKPLRGVVHLPMLPPVTEGQTRPALALTNEPASSSGGPMLALTDAPTAPADNEEEQRVSEVRKNSLKQPYLGCPADGLSIVC